MCSWLNTVGAANNLETEIEELLECIVSDVKPQQDTFKVMNKYQKLTASSIFTVVVVWFALMRKTCIFDAQMELNMHKNF